MNIRILDEEKIAILESDDVLIIDTQSALDLAMTVQYQTSFDKIIINKSSISEEFFELKTRLAGDVLQKYTNYHIRIAIVGDFSVYSSSSLKAFIVESNRGTSVFFLESEEEAIEKLSKL